METEDNKGIYRRFIEEAFNQGRLDTMDELFAPDYVNHSAAPGVPPDVKSVKQTINLYHSALQDLNVEVHDPVAEDDMVNSRLTVQGRHRGPLYGVSPTGRDVLFPGLSMVRVDSGQIQEGWIVIDIYGLLQQLCAPDAPAPAAS